MEKIVVLGLMVMLLACGERKNSQDVNQKEAASTENEVLDQVLQSNNGQRWEINKEMWPYIQSAEQKVMTSQKETISDYHAMAEELKMYNQQLIKSCTMKGEAHEQLHHWLYPYLDKVKQLSAVKQLDEAKILHAQLKTSFEQYHEFFRLMGE